MRGWEWPIHVTSGANSRSTPMPVDEPMDGLGRAAAEREGDVGVAPVAVLSENVRGHLLRGVRDPGRALEARPRRGDEAAGDERVRGLARILFEQHDFDTVPERGRGRRGHEARSAASHDDHPGLGRPLHGCATGRLPPPPPRGRRRPRSRVPRPPSCLGPPRCGCHVGSDLRVERFVLGRSRKRIVTARSAGTLRVGPRSSGCASTAAPVDCQAADLTVRAPLISGGGDRDRSRTARAPERVEGRT